MSRPRAVSLARIAALSVLAMSFAVASASAQTSITTCGQVITGSASLDADIDCTGSPDPSITIDGGTLTMNGHTITGGNSVYCTRNCKLIGPGTITESRAMGIQAENCSAILDKVNITNSEMYALQAWNNAVVKGPATISGNLLGIRSAKIKVTDVTITGNVTNAIEAANNAGRGAVSITRSTISNNGGAVYAQSKISVVDSTITGNGMGGLLTGETLCGRKSRVSLKRSTVTGNASDAACGSTIACPDVSTCHLAPKIGKGASCDHSYQGSSGIPGLDWDVCALD